MDDLHFMKEALLFAKAAEDSGEVPIGAVLVDEDGAVLSSSGNTKEKNRDATCHAEMNVLKSGAEKVGKYFNGCTLYVTLEPCAMCAGAMVNARLSRLVFGAYDPKGGAAGTVLNVLNNPKLNHSVEVLGGVLEAECASVLTEFFQKKREEKR